MEAHLNFSFKFVQPFSCYVLELWQSAVSVTWTSAPWKPHASAVLARHIVDTGMWLCSSHCEFGVWGVWCHTDQETTSEVCLPSCSLFPSCFHMPFIASCVSHLSFFSPSLTCRLAASGMESGWHFSSFSSLQPSCFPRQQVPVCKAGGQLVLPCLGAVQPPAGRCWCVGDELAAGKEWVRKQPLSFLKDHSLNWCL